MNDGRQAASKDTGGQVLTGGTANAGLVVRFGDVVHRPAPPNVATLHTLLRHLRSQGVPVPKPVAVTEDGQEVVGYLPGQVPVPPFPPWVSSVRILHAVGRLVRGVHDASRSFQAPSGAEWSSALADPAGGPVICHDDVCLENVVFSGGRAVGLLDLDFAAPGRPVWDLAMTARYWVPLTDPAEDTSGRAGLDRAARLRALVDAYGADDRMRRSFTEVLIQVEGVALAFVLDRVAAGQDEFVDMWRSRGGHGWHRRKMAWLESQLDLFDAALSRPSS